MLKYTNKCLISIALLLIMQNTIFCMLPHNTPQPNNITNNNDMIFFLVGYKAGQLSCTVPINIHNQPELLRQLQEMSQSNPVQKNPQLSSQKNPKKKKPIKIGRNSKYAKYRRSDGRYYCDEKGCIQKNDGIEQPTSFSRMSHCKKHIKEYHNRDIEKNVIKDHHHCKHNNCEFSCVHTKEMEAHEKWIHGEKHDNICTHNFSCKQPGCNFHCYTKVEYKTHMKNIHKHNYFCKERKCTFSCTEKEKHIEHKKNHSAQRTLDKLNSSSRPRKKHPHADEITTKKRRREKKKKTNEENISPKEFISSLPYIQQDDLEIPLPKKRLSPPLKKRKCFR